MTSSPGNCESWATTALLHPSFQGAEEQASIRTIRALLETRITPQTAAVAIASTYELSVKQAKPQLWALWRLFNNVVEHLGHDLENLALLARTARSMSTLPDVLDEHGNPIKDRTRNQVYWRDMPLFAYYFSEGGIECVSLETLDRGLGWKRERANRKLFNSNAFAAMYLLQLDPEGPRYDFWYMRRHAINHLTSALEIALETHFQLRILKTYLPPAAMWILIAGRNIYRYCKDYLDYKGENVYQRRLHGSELTWTGRDGFGLERWAFWRTRFGEISTLEGVAPNVMECAIQAAREMESIEHEMESIEHEMESIEHEMESIEHEMESIEHEMESIEHELNTLT